MKKLLKWLGLSVLAVVVLVLLFVGYHVLAFNRAAARVYEVQPLDIVASTDSLVLTRGEHLAGSIGACLGCHGDALEGAVVEDLGPLGVMVAPNLTTGRGGVGGSYTDGELARALRHGIRRDGRSLRFMPAPDFAWWPDDDLTAIVSYVRSVPPVDNDPGATHVGTLSKVLTRLGLFPILSAEDVDHDTRPDVPDPAPTAEYGRFLAISCTPCHGEGFSGGPIPGAPASMAVPSNITPHATGLAGWSEEDFRTLLATGRRPDGTTVDPFMPLGTLDRMNETEKAALWTYLQSLEPVEFGNR